MKNISPPPPKKNTPLLKLFFSFDLQVFVIARAAACVIPATEGASSLDRTAIIDVFRSGHYSTGGGRDHYRWFPGLAPGFC